MYNGIGLPTPRGSGTNGYVQRNLLAVRHKKDRADYKSEEELRKLESSLVKKPNQDILDHERKRKVELKCLELAELMEEQGCGEGEIQEKVATFRMMLLEKDVAVVKEGEQQQKSSITETHQLAEANEKKNERLRAAFGISDSYVDGSSFDPNRRAKEAATAAVAKQQQEQHSLIKDSSSSQSPSPKQKKNKKKDRGRCESRSPFQRERKKSSKKKKHRSESKKRKHRSPSPKSKHKSKEKKRKRSTSESASQKDHRDHSSSPDDSSSLDASHSRSGSPIVQKRNFLRRQSKSPLSSSQKPDTEAVSKNLGEKERSSSAEPARRGRSTGPQESREKREKISKHSSVRETLQRSPSPSSPAKERERDKDRKSARHGGQKFTPSLEHEPKSMHHSPVLNDRSREKRPPSKEERSSCSSPSAKKQSEDRNGTLPPSKAKISLDHKEELTASSSVSKAVKNKLKRSHEDSTPQVSLSPSEIGSYSSSSSSPSSSPSPPIKAAPVAHNCSPEGPPKRQDKEKASTQRVKSSLSPEISCFGQKQSSKTSRHEPSSTPPAKGSKSRASRRDKSLSQTPTTHRGRSWSWTPPKRGRSRTRTPPRRGRSRSQRCSRSHTPLKRGCSRTPQWRAHSRTPQRWGRSRSCTPPRWDRSRTPQRCGWSHSRTPQRHGWSRSRNSGRWGRSRTPRRGRSRSRTPRRGSSGSRSPPRRARSHSRTQPRRGRSRTRMPPRRGRSRSSPRRDKSLILARRTRSVSSPDRKVSRIFSRSRSYSSTRMRERSRKVLRHSLSGSSPESRLKASPRRSRSGSLPKAKKKTWLPPRRSRSTSSPRSRKKRLRTPPRCSSSSSPRVKKKLRLSVRQSRSGFSPTPKKKSRSPTRRSQSRSSPALKNNTRTSCWSSSGSSPRLPRKSDVSSAAEEKAKNISKRSRSGSSPALRNKSKSSSRHSISGSSPVPKIRLPRRQNRSESSPEVKTKPRIRSSPMLKREMGSSPRRSRFSSSQSSAKENSLSPIRQAASPESKFVSPLQQSRSGKSVGSKEKPRSQHRRQSRSRSPLALRETSLSPLRPVASECSLEIKKKSSLLDKCKNDSLELKKTRSSPRQSTSGTLPMTKDQSTSPSRTKSRYSPEMTNSSPLKQVRYGLFPQAAVEKSPSRRSESRSSPELNGNSKTPKQNKFQEVKTKSGSSPGHNKSSSMAVMESASLPCQKHKSGSSLSGKEKLYSSSRQVPSESSPVLKETDIPSRGIRSSSSSSSSTSSTSPEDDKSQSPPRLSCSAGLSINKNKSISPPTHGGKAYSSPVPENSTFAMVTKHNRPGSAPEIREISKAAVMGPRSPLEKKGAFKESSRRSRPGSYSETKEKPKMHSSESSSDSSPEWKEKSESRSVSPLRPRIKSKTPPRCRTSRSPPRSRPKSRTPKCGRSGSPPRPKLKSRTPRQRRSGSSPRPRIKSRTPPRQRRSGSSPRSQIKSRTPPRHYHRAGSSPRLRRKSRMPPRRRSASQAREKSRTPVTRRQRYVSSVSPRCKSRTPPKCGQSRSLSREKSITSTHPHRSESSSYGDGPRTSLRQERSGSPSWRSHSRSLSRRRDKSWGSLQRERSISSSARSCSRSSSQEKSKLPHRGHSQLPVQMLQLSPERTATSRNASHSSPRLDKSRVTASYKGTGSRVSPDCQSSPVRKHSRSGSQEACTSPGRKSHSPPVLERYPKSDLQEKPASSSLWHSKNNIAISCALIPPCEESPKLQKLLSPDPSMLHDFPPVLNNGDSIAIQNSPGDRNQSMHQAIIKDYAEAGAPLSGRSSSHAGSLSPVKAKLSSHSSSSSASSSPLLALISVLVPSPKEEEIVSEGKVADRSEVHLPTLEAESQLASVTMEDDTRSSCPTVLQLTLPSPLPSAPSKAKRSSSASSTSSSLSSSSSSSSTSDSESSSSESSPHYQATKDLEAEIELKQPPSPVLKETNRVEQPLEMGKHKCHSRNSSSSSSSSSSSASSSSSSSSSPSTPLLKTGLQAVIKSPPKKKPSPEKRKSLSPRKPIDSLRDSHSLSYSPADWCQISPPAQPPSAPRDRRRDRSRDRSLQRNRQSISVSPRRKQGRKSPSPRAPRCRTSRSP